MHLAQRIQFQRWLRPLVKCSFALNVMLACWYFSRVAGWTYGPKAEEILLPLGAVTVLTLTVAALLLLWQTKILVSITLCPQTGDGFIATAKPVGLRGVELHIDFDKVGPCDPARPEHRKGGENVHFFEQTTRLALLSLRDMKSVDEIVVGSAHLELAERRATLLNFIATEFHDWSTTVDREFKLSWFNACALPIFGRWTFLARCPSFRTPILLSRFEARTAKIDAQLRTRKAKRDGTPDSSPKTLAGRLIDGCVAALNTLLNRRRYYRVVMRRGQGTSSP
jgi:hypothetical protein